MPSAAMGAGDRSSPLQGRAWQPQEFEDAVEVVVAVVFDLDSAFFDGVVDGYVGGEVFLEAFGDLADVDVDLLGGRLFRVGFAGEVGEE